MKIFNIVFSYFKHHVGVLLLTLLVIALTIALALIPPEILCYVVDHVLTKDDKTELLWFSLLYVTVLVFVSLVNFLKEILLIVISQGIGKDLRLAMLTKVNHLTYAMFKEYDTGKLEAYFSNDVDEINALITSGVISIAIDMFKVIGIVVAIFVFSPVFGGITLAILPCLGMFTFLVRKGMFSAQSKNRELEGEVNNAVSETLDNMETIQSYRIYDQTFDRYDQTLKAHFRSNQKANFFDAFFSPVMQIVKFALIVALLLITGINASFFAMTLGMIVSSLDLITNLFAPMDSLGMEIQTIQKSRASLKRIEAFLSLPEDEKKAEMQEMDFKECELKFDHVYYSYDKKENVITDFSLTLKGNQRLTLKGQSGSGKSTLFRLAYGLIRPDQGRVTINGYDTYRLPEKMKRKLFSVVYQDYFFSFGTIKEELTMKEEGFCDEQVLEVLKEVGLERIQDIHAPFYEHDYSTGELSLFNIARALLLDSKILFLDEMNAKVDPLTAKKVMQVVSQVSKTKMVLSINHYGDLLEDSSVCFLTEKQPTGKEE